MAALQCFFAWRLYLPIEAPIELPEEIIELEIPIDLDTIELPEPDPIAAAAPSAASSAASAASNTTEAKTGRPIQTPPARSSSAQPARANPPPAAVRIESRATPVARAPVVEPSLSVAMPAPAAVAERSAEVSLELESTAIAPERVLPQREVDPIAVETPTESLLPERQLDVVQIPIAPEAVLKPERQASLDAAIALDAQPVDLPQPNLPTPPVKVIPLPREPTPQSIAVELPARPQLNLPSVSEVATAPEKIVQSEPAPLERRPKIELSKPTLTTDSPSIAPIAVAPEPITIREQVDLKASNKNVAEEALAVNQDTDLSERPAPNIAPIATGDADQSETENSAARTATRGQGEAIDTSSLFDGMSQAAADQAAAASQGDGRNAFRRYADPFAEDLPNRFSGLRMREPQLFLDITKFLVSQLRTVGVQYVLTQAGAGEEINDFTDVDIGPLLRAWEQLHHGDLTKACKQSYADMTADMREVLCGSNR